MTEQQIERARELRKLFWTPWRIARFLKVSPEEVRAVLKIYVAPRLPMAPEVVERAREMARQGVTRFKIANELGFGHHAINNAVADIVPPISRKTREVACKSPEVKAAKRLARTYRMPEDDIEVPGWVPDELTDIYINIAHRDGEEIAASLCRKLKAGGAVQCR